MFDIVLTPNDIKYWTYFPLKCWMEINPNLYGNEHWWFLLFLLREPIFVLRHWGRPLAFTACLNCGIDTKANTVNTERRPRGSAGYPERRGLVPFHQDYHTVTVTYSIGISTVLCFTMLSCWLSTYHCVFRDSASRRVTNIARWLRF